MGGNAIGGCKAAMVGGSPGTGGMATADASGDNPASIPGGNIGGAVIRPGELVPFTGSCTHFDKLYIYQTNTGGGRPQVTRTKPPLGRPSKPDQSKEPLTVDFRSTKEQILR